MDSKRWDQIDALFNDLVELTEVEQDARLATVGAVDAELRRHVEALIAADREVEQRLSPLEAWSHASEDGGSVTTEFVPDPFQLTGRTVSHFRVLEPLGAGGMGVVYRGEDVQLRREVALKFLLPQYSLDPVAKERFLREARSAAALDHPNICTFHEVGQSEDGQLFLAMTRYAGETLKECLAREGALPIARAREIACQIARGLAAAHDAGIVHRDLKAGNLMLTPDGTVKILDFGLAKVRDLSLTASGMHLGTVAYMAPEQLGGKPSDARADLWALGVVLNEMLTGRRPFEAEHEVSIVHAILHDEPPRPGALRADIPEELEGVVLRLMRKEPAERYSTADDVLDGLSDAAGHLSAALEGATTSGRAPTFSFLSELRRRHVVGIALVYAGAAYAVIEAAGLVAPRLGIPQEAVTVVLALAMLGLPVACVLAWTFERTPDGVRRTVTMPPVPRDRPGSAAKDFGTWRSPPPRGPWLSVRSTVLAVALIACGLLMGWAARRASEDPVPGRLATAGPAPRVAVLPFRNTSGGERNAILAAGIHEAVITHLSKIARLDVTSRTSVMEYRDQRNLQDIAAELGVTHVIEGGAQIEGDRVRVSAQLIDAATDQYVWAEEYNRDFGVAGILDIQAEIARQIASVLSVVLDRSEAARLRSAYVPEPIAYEHYLRSIAGLREAQETFRPLGLTEVERQAVAATHADSAYVDAWGLLARVHFETWESGLDPTPGRLESARAAAERTLELDPQQPQGNATLGAYLMAGAGADAALPYLRLAEAYEPSDARTLSLIAQAEAAVGASPEIVEEYALKAVALDPRNQVTRRIAGRLMMKTGRLDTADRLWEELIRQTAGRNWEPVFGLTWTELVRTGRPEAARDRFNDLRERLGWDAGISSQVLAQLPVLLRETHYDSLLLSPLSPRTRPCGGICLSARAWVHHLRGRAAAARATWDSAAVDMGRPPPEQHAAEAAINKALRALYLARAGRTAEALQTWRGAVPNYGHFELSDLEVLWFPQLLVQVEAHDSAVAVLNRSRGRYTFHHPIMFRLSPVWDALRDHPGFRSLLAAER